MGGDQRCPSFPHQAAPTEVRRRSHWFPGLSYLAGLTVEVLALAFEVYISRRRMGVGPYPCVLAVEDTGLNWANLPLKKTDVCVFCVQLGPGCVLAFQAGGTVALLKTRRRQKRRAVRGSARGHRELSQYPRSAAAGLLGTPYTPQTLLRGPTHGCTPCGPLPDPVPRPKVPSEGNGPVLWGS